MSLSPHSPNQGIKGGKMLMRLVLSLALSLGVAGGAQAATVFQDNMESGSGSWIATGLWHWADGGDPCPDANSGSASWYYGNSSCDFDTGVTNSGSLTSPSISIPATGITQVSFWYLYETEEEGTSYDRRYVQVSVDGGAYQNLEQLSGDTMNVWHQEVLDLSVYAGHDVQLRFAFDTIDSIGNNYKGWYIDDVLVYNTRTTYRFEPASSYNWVDISATGTNLGINCDDCGVVTATGFNFPFFGNAYSSVGVSSNGYLTFGPNISDFTNDDIPNVTNPSNYIAPFWDDLRVYVNKSGSVYRQLVGSAPNRSLIIQYENVDFCCSPDNGKLYFQVILSEDGSITFQYKDMLSVDVGQGGGGSATIGIENSAGTDGLKWSYNSVNVTDGQAIMFAPSGFLDSDGDGLPDYWEWIYGTNSNDAGSPVQSEDVDGDGLSWIQEYQAETNPLVADTDSDGVNDGDEIGAGTDPIVGNGPATILTFVGPGAEFGTAYFRFSVGGFDGSTAGYRVYYGPEHGATIKDYPAYFDINDLDARDGYIDQKWGMQGVSKVYFRIAPFKTISGRKYVGTPSNELATYFSGSLKDAAISDGRDGPGQVVSQSQGGGGVVSINEIAVFSLLTLLAGFGARGRKAAKR